MPNSSGWSRSTARSEIASPPSASITATSASTRPGSCLERRCRSPPSASLKACGTPVTSARSASSRDPACETTPRPSAVTVTTGRVVVFCTEEVPSRLDHSDS